MLTLADGRLRYDDTVRIGLKETARSVRSALEVDFGGEGWTKIPTDDAESMHFQITREYGKLDLTMTVRQIGSAFPAEKAIVEVVAVIQTVGSVK